MKTIILTYGIDLTQDAAACRDIRTRTAAVLRLGECLTIALLRR